MEDIEEIIKGLDKRNTKEKRKKKKFFQWMDEEPVESSRFVKAAVAAVIADYSLDMFIEMYQEEFGTPPVSKSTAKRGLKEYFEEGYNGR